MSIRMKAFTLAAAGIAALLVGVPPASAGSVPESSDPIKLAVNEWTGQHVTTYIAGNILSRMGYNVEYVTAGALPQFAAVADGTLSATLEVWTNSVGDVYPKAVESGDIVVLGDLGLQAKESWVYPPYMAEKCPGLPNWKALYDCPEAFASADTYPKGRMISYPADWGTRSADLVAATGLPFVAIPGGSEGAMIAEIKSAVAAKEPVLVMFWAPHWLLAEIDLDWVEFPKYEPGCDTDPSLGVNPNAVNDCGFEQAKVQKAVWKGMKDKWPAAVRFLTNFQIDNDAQNRMMLEIDQKGRDLKDVTNEWVENNTSKWQAWVNAATM